MPQETTPLPFKTINYTELPFSVKYLFTNEVWKKTDFLAEIVCRQAIDNYKEYVIEAKTFQNKIMEGINIWPFINELQKRKKASIISVVVYTDNSFTIQFEMN